MNKAELNAKYREYSKNYLSPTEEERQLVTRIYEALKGVLSDNCILIGSYARFTAGRPLHDIDVLFVAGAFDPRNLSPQVVLGNLQSAVQRTFKNPTQYQLKISVQSHSITLSFLEGDKERLGVDIVPAFVSGVKNEFGDDVYWVPEILLVGRRNRQAIYATLSKSRKTEIEWWLKSDPRGYIRATTKLNATNEDFRRASKFIKKWKHNCCAAYDDFNLKSFHIEQVLFNIFLETPGIEITDAVFEFFCTIPQVISRPQIRDRANAARYVDQYLADLTEVQKQRIIEARDFFLIKLEYLSENTSIAELLKAGLHRRARDTEKYLFDSKIPVFLQPGAPLAITANVLARDGFRPAILNALGLINIDRKIKFDAVARNLDYDLLKWKVKNDDNCPQPRGEITDHATRNNPESTKFQGRHYVECYAIKKGACVARARQIVELRTP